MQMVPTMSLAMVGDLAGIATAVCWAACSLLFTAGGKRVGSLAVNMIRLTLGLAMLTLYGTVVHGQIIPTDATGHAWLWLGLSGVMGMAICDLCLFESFLLVGPRVGMLLLTLSPPVAAEISWVFLSEGLTGLNLVGMGMVLAGIAWVVLERREGPDGQRHRHPVAGVLLGVVGAVTQGIGAVLSKVGMVRQIDGEAVEQCPPFAAAQVREIAGLAAMVMFYFLIRAWPKTISALRDRRAMGYISAGAFFGPFLGVALSMVAIRHLPVGIATTFIMMAPVFVIPLTVILHKEKVGVRAVAGALVAVAGVGVLMLKAGNPIYDWWTNVVF